MIGETTQVTGKPMARKSMNAAATGIQRVAIAALMVVCGLAMSAGRAEAQKKPSLFIAAEGLDGDDDAQKCGITKDSLRAPAVLILRQNGIDVASTSTNPYLYLNLNMLSTGASCIYALNVAIHYSLNIEVRNGFRASSYEYSQLCREGSTGIVPARDALKKITETVELELISCLADVFY